MKVGILIPCTSKNRPWKNLEESYLYSSTLKTFLLTYDKEHEYIFYIGIDRNDPIYDNETNKMKLQRFCSIMKNISIEFMFMDGVKKGHLTIMWNKLYKKAYDDNCEYFFQCGDDIKFTTKGWVNDSIKVLQDNSNVGVSGPINNNSQIITQTFVSRKHMELFGYYFPPEIINWCCDDWINLVYRKMNRFFPLTKHFCDNIGGPPRYDVNNEQFASQEQLRERVLKMRKAVHHLADKQCKSIQGKY
jgi:hypothetical protein